MPTDKPAWNKPAAIAELPRMSAPRVRAKDVPKYRTPRRTQLPIHKCIPDILSHLGDKFGLRLDNGSTIYMPGRSRPMGDNDFLERHQQGLACDIMLSAVIQPPGMKSVVEATKTLTAVANYLLENATRMGVSRIIWLRSIVDADGFNPYDGSSPHDDHIHFEVNHNPPFKCHHATNPGTPWIL